MFTDAPIFTTIDNGQLVINLDNLELKTSRNFSPTPDVFLSSDEGYALSFEPHPQRKFSSYNALIKKYQGKKIHNKSVFGEEVYIVENDGNSKYYYKYGQLYLKMEQVNELYSSVSSGSSYESSSEDNDSSSSS